MSDGRATATLEDVRAQVGREFPGGHYTLEPWRVWLTCDAALAQPDAELAHPLLAWMAAVGGMGITWDELFSWFGATAADGPMFGEHETTLHRPLRVGTTYQVSGGIVSAERKVGRAAGTFDLVGYRTELRDVDDGARVATCWNSIVFPRRTS
ncbi:hypothetical protein [Georgenia sp. AZ-5]|uniref:hypothetical protein n=1 Tax=Georgenia sp. AZ-5 TaxID=3367526 RepID=UPI0037549763